MRFFISLFISFFFFSFFLACTPRNYEMKTTSTATTVLETKTSVYLVSWNEINNCDLIIDPTTRLDCYVSLMGTLERAKRHHAEKALIYQDMYNVVQAKACAVYTELDKERDAPKACGFVEQVFVIAVEAPEVGPVVMDVYLCEICPSVKYFVRGADNPRTYPEGWKLALVKESGKEFIQLEINGNPVGAKMDKPFSHYVIEARSPDEILIMRVEGYETPCDPLNQV